MFSPDGRIVFSADRDCLRLSDAATLTTFDELRPGGQVRGICLIKDGDVLVIGGQGVRSAGGAASLAVVELARP